MSEQADSAITRAEQRQGALLTCFWVGALPILSWLVHFIQAGDQRALTMTCVTLMWFALLTVWQVRPGPKWVAIVLTVVGILPVMVMGLLFPQELSPPGMAAVHTIVAVLAAAWLPIVSPVVQHHFRDAALTIAGLLGTFSLLGSVVMWLLTWPAQGAMAGVTALLSVVWLGWLVFWSKRRRDNLHRPWLAAGTLIPVAAVVAVVSRTTGSTDAIALAATFSLAGFLATAMLPTNLVRRYPSVASMSLSDGSKP